VDLELDINILQVKRNGVDADFEFSGGFIAVALDQQLEDFGLLTRQPLSPTIWRAAFPEQLDHPTSLRWPPKRQVSACSILDHRCLRGINSNTEEGSLAGGASCLLGNSMPVAVGRQWAGKA